MRKVSVRRRLLYLDYSARLDGVVRRLGSRRKFYSLKKVVSSFTVIGAGLQATLLENEVRSHTDTDRSGRASQSVLCQCGLSEDRA